MTRNDFTDGDDDAQEVGVSVLLLETSPGTGTAGL
jgi:hypothetical protein